MENSLPRHLAWEMEQMGVLPMALPYDVPDEPRVPRTVIYDFNLPDLDAYGEPPC